MPKLRTSLPAKGALHTQKCRGRASSWLLPSCSLYPHYSMDKQLLLIVRKSGKKAHRCERDGHYLADPISPSHSSFFSVSNSGIINMSYYAQLLQCGFLGVKACPCDFEQSTLLTELVYRKQLRPVIQSGATVMDRLFAAPGWQSGWQRPENSKKPGSSGEEPGSGLL